VNASATAAAGGGAETIHIKAGAMKDRFNPMFGRRDVLRAVSGAAIIAAASTAPAAPAAADSETNSEKRKARYQANSPEVQTFYRVNRYPGA
jgi:hypothetical protein